MEINKLLKSDDEILQKMMAWILLMFKMNKNKS